MKIAYAPQIFQIVLCWLRINVIITKTKMAQNKNIFKSLFFPPGIHSCRLAVTERIYWGPWDDAHLFPLLFIAGFSTAGSVSLSASKFMFLV